MNSDEQSLAGNMVNDLYVDSTGNLWIATSMGLDRLSVAGKRFIHYHNDPSFSKSLSNDEVLAIYEDRGGVLWFGTSTGGVNKYDRQRDNFAYYRNDPGNKNSLSDNSIISCLLGLERLCLDRNAGEKAEPADQIDQVVIHYQN
jgi:ligand-binding sensor domain-containing protein